MKVVWFCAPGLSHPSHTEAAEQAGPPRDTCLTDCAKDHKMRVLGVNAVFHDPAAALVVDGQVVAAAEEERFTRRKHGKLPVPFATWELPEQSAAWCLAEAGLAPDDLDAVAYSYDPALAPPAGPDVTADAWEGLRTLYAERAPLFLRTALPGLDPACVRYVPHHVAHAASAHLAAPYRSSSVLVLDGRGEAASHLAGRSVDGDLEILAAQRLPHSLGLLYEEVTDHLGFRRSSDEYKVMALAAYGKPAYLRELREAVRVTGDGGFTVAPIELNTLAKRRGKDEEWTGEHADLAASDQLRLQEDLLELVRWLHAQTGDRDLATARVAYERPPDLAGAVAEVIAADGVVAWFQGRSEYGPRALGHRSLLANATRAANLERLNDVKGREQFRPVAPMVLAERAGDIFEGPMPSPYMLFTHRVRPAWRERIPAVVHVDGSARIQTVDRDDEPLVARLLEAVERRTGVPVVVNTSLNTAGRPMVDDPRDALECFGSTPVDLLALGPFLVRRADFTRP